MNTLIKNLIENFFLLNNQKNIIQSFSLTLIRYYSNDYKRDLILFLENIKGEIDLIKEISEIIDSYNLHLKKYSDFQSEQELNNENIDEPINPYHFPYIF